MKQRINNGILPLSALLIFITVALINTLEMVSSSQWNKFEMMSNGFMFVVVVVGFFLQGLPNKIVKGDNGRNILSNVAVSLIAFLMNVTIFEHTIQLKQFWNSLWGWSMGWIVVAVIQVLLLSELGKKLLNRICAFLIWCESIIGLVRRTGYVLWDTIRRNKSMCCIAVVGIILWGAYLGIQVYVSGASAVFTSTDIFEKSVWFWVTYSVICILVYGIGVSLKKFKDIIENLPDKKVLVVLVGLALIVIVSVIPSMLKVIAIGFLIPLVAMGMLWFVVRKIDKMGKNTENDNLQGNDSVTINLNDLFIVVISIVGIPLAIICFATWLQIHNEQSIVMKDVDNISIWLDFVNVAGDVAKRLLELFI